MVSDSQNPEWRNLGGTYVLDLAERLQVRFTDEGIDRRVNGHILRFEYRTQDTSIQAARNTITEDGRQVFDEIIFYITSEGEKYPRMRQYLTKKGETEAERRAETKIVDTVRRIHNNRDFITKPAEGLPIAEALKSFLDKINDYIERADRG